MRPTTTFPSGGAGGRTGGSTEHFGGRNEQVTYGGPRGRLAAFALLLVGGAGPVPAAQTSTTPLTKTVNMTGTAKNGKKFKGTYTIKRFTHSGSKLYAVGTLKGRLKGRRVIKTNWRSHLGLACPSRFFGGRADPSDADKNACQILNLTLQPIDLNLLGLRLLRTSRIDLRLEGVPGAGNLLGNLLCGITGILDPQAATPATPSVLTQVLNALLALVPRTA